jgi:glycosyltransferase involved in cell wall biosynthesis
VVEGRTGFLAPVDDPAGLALATRRLLELDPDARRVLGAAGRERVLARHTLSGMVDRLLQVYAEVT